MHLVLIPGFWLDASSWDEVAPALRAVGHDVHALTVPGLESRDADRSRISLRDHVDADVPFAHELGLIHDKELVDLPTGHWPQFTRPGDLAEAILRAVRTE